MTTHYQRQRLDEKKARTEQDKVAPKPLANEKATQAELAVTYQLTKERIRQVIRARTARRQQEFEQEKRRTIEPKKIALAPEAKTRIEAEIQRYNKDAHTLDQMRAGISHKTRRQTELKRLAKAMKTLSPDTIGLLNLHRLEQADLSKLQRAIQGALGFDRGNTRKYADLPKLILLSRLSVIFEVETGRRASPVDNGCFSQFVDVALRGRNIKVSRRTLAQALESGMGRLERVVYRQTYTD